MDRDEYNRHFGEMQDLVLRIGGRENFRVRERGPHPQGDGQDRPALIAPSRYGEVRHG